jgi:VWFA-related protein
MMLVHVANHSPSSPPRASSYFSYFLLLVLTTSLSFAPHIFAQDSNVPSDEIIRISTDLVTVPVVVTNGRGERVSGLMKDDFVVRDEGILMDVAHFGAGTDRVALAFLLDASGSTRDIISQQREAALALLSRFGRTSRVAVLHFSSQSELVVPFTDDLSKASSAFRFLPLPGQRTAIFDAALAAARAFKVNTHLPTERRIVILISDGLDTASTVTAADAIREANARDVSFYVIHLPLYTPRGGRLAARPASKGFRELAAQTGGRSFTIGDAQSSLNPHAKYDLDPVFKAVADDLNGQYVIGYYLSSPDHARQSRRPDVALTSPHHRKLRVRALREGTGWNDR